MNTHALMHSFTSCRSMFIGFIFQILDTKTSKTVVNTIPMVYYKCLYILFLQYDVCDRNIVSFNDYFWSNFTILFRYFTYSIVLCLEIYFFFSEDCLFQIREVTKKKTNIKIREHTPTAVHVKWRDRVHSDNMAKFAAEENKMRCQFCFVFRLNTIYHLFCDTLRTITNCLKHGLMRLNYRKNAFISFCFEHLNMNSKHFSFMNRVLLGTTKHLLVSH